MSLLIPVGATLMEWREPNAYTRKDLSHGRWIGLVIVLMIPAVLLAISAINHNFSKGRLILASVFLALGIVIYLRVWFGPGNVVCLKELCVVRSSGKYGSRSDYGEIESCTICEESYECNKYSVIKFKLKGKSKFRINTPVEKIIIPEDVNLDQVLHILQDKGVKVVEEPLLA
jgi:hypothetical protein